MYDTRQIIAKSTKKKPSQTRGYLAKGKKSNHKPRRGAGKSLSSNPKINTQKEKLYSFMPNMP